jgi:hypothetical protein
VRLCSTINRSSSKDEGKTFISKFTFAPKKDILCKKLFQVISLAFLSNNYSGIVRGESPFFL